MSTTFAPSPIDSPAAWRRLVISLMVGSVGCVGFWSYVVALPAVQADFGVTRGEASLPYTLVMVGFAFGGLVMGWVTDRFGVFAALVGGAALMALAYGLSGLSSGIVSFALAQALLGIGCSACFSPLMADISHWFERRRGLAVYDTRLVGGAQHGAVAARAAIREPRLGQQLRGRERRLL